ncbi:ParA family partition ATPase [Salinibacter altiplanensis]|uniref:ParA family partition ATPase n=1 Tax=Salinibacter altiplanensis TaxID=1803181 RepID=UPI000C9FF901|nr:ParA family partition ATPase [Salinibacter altiplanensis]
MRVVAVLNQKGGSGKTTIATNLACGVQRRGYRVALVDADPQKTASEWAARGDDTPPTYEATKDLETNVPALSGSFDVVVIDGAPRMTELATSAVKVADLILIPVQPSGADIWAAEDILDIIEARQKVAGGPDAAFVVSRAVAQTNLAATIRGALESYGVRVLDTRTGHRVAYPEALGAGLSVLDTSGKAAEEIESLTTEVIDLLTNSNE